MKNNNRFLLTVLPIFTMILLSACGKGNSNKKILKIDNSIVSEKALTIDTFSDFPAEIDGCSCYFSNNLSDFKNSKYIYVNDFAQTSFLRINGTLIKFTQTFFKEVNKENRRAKYKSDNYEMTIEVKDGKQSGDETTIETGTIKLSDKHGKILTKKFYGECGC